MPILQENTETMEKQCTLNYVHDEHVCVNESSSNFSSFITVCLCPYYVFVIKNELGLPSYHVSSSHFYRVLPGLC